MKTLTQLFAIMALVGATFAAAAGQEVRTGRASYRVVPDFPQVPPALTLGAVSAVATDSGSNVLVFHRGEPPILIFGRHGKLLRSFGDGLFTSAHGLRI